MTQYPVQPPLVAPLTVTRILFTLAVLFALGTGYVMGRVQEVVCAAGTVFLPIAERHLAHSVESSAPETFTTSAGTFTVGSMLFYSSSPQPQYAVCGLTPVVILD